MEYDPSPPVIAETFPKLDSPLGRVVITGLGPIGFWGPGKVQPTIFLPPFVYELQRHQLETEFVSNASEMTPGRQGTNTCLIHIYNEVQVKPEQCSMPETELGVQTVFNRSQLGPLVADKARTNTFLADHRIRVPQIMTGASAPRSVFSNENRNTSAEVTLIDHPSDLDPRRYNTEYIDTRREFEGRMYHTTVRMMSVGRELIHAFVRARPVDEGCPSVHAKDTPLYPALLRALHQELVSKRWSDLLSLSADLADALGPGFFAHDLLTCRNSGDIYVCETGFKFNDSGFTNRILPVAAHTEEHSFMFTPDFAARAARAFVRECRRLGCFQWAART